MIQWLGVCTFTAGARVQSLIREIRSHKSSGMAEKKRERDERTYTKSHS